MHGHTWEVTAWFSNSTADAVGLQSRLRSVLRRFDHKTLPDELSRGEAIAQAVGEELGDCDEVIVARTVEGIFAQWIASPPTPRLPRLAKGRKTVGKLTRAARDLLDMAAHPAFRHDGVMLSGAREFRTAKSLDRLGLGRLSISDRLKITPAGRQALAQAGAIENADQPLRSEDSHG